MYHWCADEEGSIQYDRSQRLEITGLADVWWLTRFRWRRRRIGRLTSGMDTVIMDLKRCGYITTITTPTFSQEENYYLYPLQWQSACHVTSTILVIVYHHLLLVQWLCSLSDCGSILFIFSIQTWRRCRSVRRVFCLPTWVTGGRKSIYQLSGFGGRGRGE